MVLAYPVDSKLEVHNLEPLRLCCFSCYQLYQLSSMLLNFYFLSECIQLIRTGESRGFAFVRYKYADEAQKAVDKLDGIHQTL